MGIGGFLASQSERDYYRYQRRSTAARVKRSCDGEIQREVAQVLGPVGVDEKLCSSVAKCLLDLELESEGQGSDSRPLTTEDGGLKWSKDVGVTAFLIKFGEGLGVCQILWMEISTFLPYRVSMGFRGDPRQANVHVCINYRSRLPGRRPHPITPLFLHSANLQGSHLLVCLDRNDVVNFRCSEGPDYRSRYRRRRDSFLYMGRVQHLNGRRSRCWRGIRNCRRPRRLAFALACSPLSSISHIFHCKGLYTGVGNLCSITFVFIVVPATIKRTPHFSTLIAIHFNTFSLRQLYKLVQELLATTLQKQNTTLPPLSTYQRSPCLSQRISQS